MYVDEAFCNRMGENARTLRIPFRIGNRRVQRSEMGISAPDHRVRHRDRRVGIIVPPVAVTGFERIDLENRSVDKPERRIDLPFSAVLIVSCAASDKEVRCTGSSVVIVQGRAVNR